MIVLLAWALAARLDKIRPTIASAKEMAAR
jgi:hypothetical protein